MTNRSGSTNDSTGSQPGPCGWIRVSDEEVEAGGPIEFVFAGADGEEQRSPVSQSIDRALEAEPIKRDASSLGGIEHDDAGQDYER